MIVIRQSGAKTGLATAVLVVVFTVLGVIGLLRFDDAQGRSTALALLVVAAVMAFVCVRALWRASVVAVIRANGIELRSGHFARWGLIRWRDIDEVFLLRSVGLKMIGLRLLRLEDYLARSPGWTHWSLGLDRWFAVGADAYLSASSMKAAAVDVVRLLRIFQHSPSLREHFGGDEIVLEFPTDVSLTEILQHRPRDEEAN